VDGSVNKRWVEDYDRLGRKQRRLCSWIITRAEDLLLEAMENIYLGLRYEPRPTVHEWRYTFSSRAYAILYSFGERVLFQL